MDITNDLKAKQWFNLFEFSDRTREIYSKYLKEFCECIGRTPGELIEESIKEVKAGLMPAERNIQGYVAQYKKYMRDKGRAVKSQAVAIACIKSFYKAYDIQLPASVRTPRKPKTLQENQNFLEKQDILKLITNAKNLRDRAMILVMATSGLSRREVRTLKVNDIIFDASDIGVISVRREKSQTDFTTFISPEATIALKNYWAERNRVGAKTNLAFTTYTDIPRQIGENTFTKIFEELAAALGYQNGDYFIKCRPHSLRKFFASALENAGTPKNKIEHMLGHTPNGNDSAYFKISVEALKQMYIKFLPYLTFEKTIEVRSLDTQDAKRLEELEKENEKLKAKLNTKDSETAELRGRLDKLDSALQSVINAAGAK